MERNDNTSSGWLITFKRYHGICKFAIEDEKLSGDENFTTEFKSEFHNFISQQNFHSDQIFIVLGVMGPRSVLLIRALQLISGEQAPGHKSS